ncbi:MAG: hypothetical protein ABI633_10325 [Burkholderiales bacterium]
MRDEIEKRFSAVNADPAQAETKLDLALAAEQAMLTARKRLDAHRGEGQA